MKKVLFAVALIMFIFISCSREKDPVGPYYGSGSGVNVDLDQLPYDSLSQYGFFQGTLVDLVPAEGVLPYDVITALFTDHAKKSRFIWMPDGVAASYVADDKPLNFGNGTVLIKNFHYDNVLPSGNKRILETRLLFKRNGLWEFANYVWNSEQTEAHFDLQGSYVPVSWTEPDGQQLSTIYRIPSSSECLTCHKQNSLPIPIGPKPQNINSIFQYEEGAMGQLQKWEEVGYLEAGYPQDISTTVKWNDASAALQDRVRAYLDMNCAHCHSDQKHCDYRPLRFAWAETVDPVNLGVCIPPEEQIDPAITHIVSAGDIQRSMLHYRLSATEENVRMPLLGRTLVHEEAVQLIGEWIEQLDPPCN